MYTQKSKSSPSEFIKSNFSLSRPEKDTLDVLEYIDDTCHNTPEDITSGKVIIKIPRFDSSAPEQGDHLHGPSPEEYWRTEYHYCSTHVQVHGNGER